jgi:hypothetical protein
MKLSLSLKTSANDAWSFGVTLYEIWTKAALPYGDMNNQKVWVEVAHGLRLSKPEACTVDVYASMMACWAEVQGQRPSMQQMAELLRRLYESYTGERAPAPQGLTSEYEMSSSSRSGNVSVVGKGSVNEYTLAMDSVIGIQMQNPVFDISSRTASGAGATYDVGGGETMQEASSTDDEGCAVYDFGTASNVHTMNSGLDDMGGAGGSRSGSTSHTLNHGRRDTVYDRGSASRARSGGADDAIYDLDSTDAVSIERSRTGTLRHKVAGAASGMRTPPTGTGRVLNLAWEEEPEHLTGARVLPEASDIYGNERGEILQGAARQAMTASDIGQQVSVQGYSCGGVLRFLGPHHERSTVRCGVELDEAIGKNDGTVGVSSTGGRVRKLASHLS